MSNYIDKIRTKDGTEYDLQGIIFDKSYIFDGEKMVVVEDFPEDYTGMRYWFGSDGIIDFEYWENGNCESSVELTVRDVSCNGISFDRKSTVFSISVDFDNLADWISNHISDVKMGDIIYSGGDVDIALVSCINSDVFVIKSFTDEDVRQWTYYKQDDEWELDEYTIRPFGTRWYLHHVELAGEEFDVVCPEDKSFTDHPEGIKPYYIGYSITADKILNMIYSSGTYYLYESNGTSYASDSSITDTVTPL